MSIVVSNPRGLGLSVCTCDLPVFSHGKSPPSQLHNIGILGPLPGICEKNRDFLKHAKQQLPAKDSEQRTLNPTLPNSSPKP